MLVGRAFVKEVTSSSLLAGTDFLLLGFKYFECADFYFGLEPVRETLGVGAVNSTDWARLCLDLISIVRV